MIRRSEGGVLASKDWVSAAFVHFHGLSWRRSHDYKDRDIVPSGDGANVLFNGKWYWIPYGFETNRVEYPVTPDAPSQLPLIQ